MAKKDDKLQKDAYARAMAASKTSRPCMVETGQLDSIRQECLRCHVKVGEACKKA